MNLQNSSNFSPIVSFMLKKKKYSLIQWLNKMLWLKNNHVSLNISEACGESQKVFTQKVPSEPDVEGWAQFMQM